MLCKAAEVVEALMWTNIAILQENNSGHFDKDFEVLVLTGTCPATEIHAGSAAIGHLLFFGRVGRITENAQEYYNA